MTKEAIAKAPAGRVTRTPVGTRNILTVKGKDPAYEYRIVNDVEDRITQFQEAGYEIVQSDSVDVGDKRAASGTSVGSAKSLSVGQGTKAFVMRIKKEWYDEDQRAKQKQIAATESAIKEPSLNGSDYGNVKVSRE
tara:strand:- start:3734 stop:4141 length:408 start_codon:yes stop_codon:yes gene_type:complete